MKVKEEYSQNPGWDDILKKYLDTWKACLYQPPYYGYIPTLDETRGKIFMMIARSKIFDNYTHVQSSNMNIQDYYDVFYCTRGAPISGGICLDEKGDHIRDTLNEAIYGDSDKYYINFLSGSRGMTP